MKKNTVIEAGNPLLKSKNKIVTDYKSLKIQNLIKNLIDTMRKTDLIGIAAPQIGENYMVFITHPRSTKARNLSKVDKLRVFINPKITFKSKKQSLIYEGCGSVADIFGPVLRPDEVAVEAIDEKGQRFSLLANGILARVIQHEYDHLEGVEFIQKVSDYSKIIVKKYYRKDIRNSALQRKNSLTTKVEYKKL